MEELLELKDLLLKGDVPGALVIVEELEEMSKQDIIDKIRSYAVILLLHLIKQQAEKRTTRSWDVSIRNSVREIQRKNKRRKAGGYYLTTEELLETLQEAYLNAIDEASLEVEEGRYQPEELEELVHQEEIINRAIGLILPQE
jgi:geranylgeranyl pyrophosphate synthase